jgi:hypothetical protein
VNTPTKRGVMPGRYLTRSPVPAILTCSLLLLPLSACRGTTKTADGHTFRSPEEAVTALQRAVKGGKIEDVVALFGPDGQS